MFSPLREESLFLPAFEAQNLRAPGAPQVYGPAPSAERPETGEGGARQKSRVPDAKKPLGEDGKPKKTFLWAIGLYNPTEKEKEGMDYPQGFSE